MRWYTKKQMEKHLQNYIKLLFPNTVYLFLPDDCIRTLKKKKTFPLMSLSQCKNNSLYYDSCCHHTLTGEHVFQFILLIQIINIINTNFHII